MNIETKLALVESSQRIVGIKEGMFVRFYEQSLFGWQQWASKQDQLPTLKVLRKKVKKLNVREVLYGGCSGQLNWPNFTLSSKLAAERSVTFPYVN